MFYVDHIHSLFATFLVCLAITGVDPVRSPGDATHVQGMTHGSGRSRVPGQASRGQPWISGGSAIMAQAQDIQLIPNRTGQGVANEDGVMELFSGNGFGTSLIHGLMSTTGARCYSDVMFHVAGANILYASLLLVVDPGRATVPMTITCGGDVRRPRPIYFGNAQGTWAVLRNKLVYRTDYLKSCAERSNEGTNGGHEQRSFSLRIAMDSSICTQRSRDYFRGMSAWLATSRLN